MHVVSELHFLSILLHIKLNSYKKVKKFWNSLTSSTSTRRTKQRKLMITLQAPEVLPLSIARIKQSPTTWVINNWKIKYLISKTSWAPETPLLPMTALATWAIHMKLSIWQIWKMQCWTRWMPKWIIIQPASLVNNTTCRQNLQDNNSSRPSWTTSSKSSSSRRTKLEKTIIKAWRWTKKMTLQIRIRNILKRQDRLDLANKAMVPARKRKSWRSSLAPQAPKLWWRWPLLTW